MLKHFPWCRQISIHIFFFNESLVNLCITFCFLQTPTRIAYQFSADKEFITSERIFYCHLWKKIMIIYKLHLQQSPLRDQYMCLNPPTYLIYHLFILIRTLQNSQPLWPHLLKTVMFMPLKTFFHTKFHDTGQNSKIWNITLPKINLHRGLYIHHI